MIKRNFELDLCRAIAIVMAVMSHMQGYLSKYFQVDFLRINVFLGVEFFVLCGFLTGKIIVKNLVVSEERFKKISSVKMA